jgi:hypothetical protein
LALLRKSAISPSVRVPLAAALLDQRLIAGLGRLQQRDRAEDVVLEQRGQAVAGGAAVVGLDRVPDVGLVLQQPGLGRREIPGWRRRS